MAYAGLIGGFLGIYVIRFLEPSVVIWHHLAVVATLLAWPLGFRVLVWRFVGGGHWGRIAVALLMLVPFVLLFTFYALVLVGLDSWGRVTTWPLIRTYAGQAPYLLDALGVSPWGGLIAVASVLLVLFWIVWRWIAPNDWTRRVARLGSMSGTVAITVGLMAVASISSYTLTRHGVGSQREPIALSFLLDAATRVLQSHSVADSALLDTRENEERRAYVPAASTQQRNLILIVGDALRADHMAVYGYGRDTTPALASLIGGKGGAVVPGVRSACGESFCGLLALAASREVSELGSAPFTIHEVLRRNSYGIHLILGGDHTNFYGLGDMYGQVDSYHDGSRQSLRYMNDDELVMDALAKFPDARPGHPVAMQFHLMSTHGLGKRDPKVSRFHPWENYYKWPGTSPKAAPSEEAAKAGVSYYDNGMLGFDSMVSRLLDQLRAKGYLDNALVVITGDHGEMLGEQGRFGHQSSISEQVLNVPLVMLRYGYEGGPLADHPIVGQIDIAPTILRELGIPVPRNWKGRALQDDWIPREYAVQQGRIFGVYHVGDDGRILKYERDLDSEVERVTDPAADPLGERNLIQAIPQALLDGWRVKSTSMMFNTVSGS